MKDEGEDGLQSGSGVSAQSQSSRVVTDNERLLHEWLTGDCSGYPPSKWGELPIEERNCVKCGVHLAEHKPFSPYRYKGEAGFFPLLDGLKAKGFRFLMTEYEVGPETTALYCLLSRDDGPDARYRGDADTLPAALLAAALKALDAEQQPTKVDTDAENEKADSTSN